MKGVKTGFGVQTFSNSSKFERYEGFFKYDSFDGNGILLWRDGQRYEGLLKNNKQHGFGKLTFSNENSFESYKGDFFEDKFHGNGTLKYKNGELYRGTFQDSHKSGFGTQTWPDNSTFVKYEGSFLFDLFEGEGVLITTNGETYSGYFKYLFSCFLIILSLLRMFQEYNSLNYLVNPFRTSLQTFQIHFLLRRSEYRIQI